MPSRESKAKRLRQNVESAVERSIRADQEVQRRQFTAKEYEKAKAKYRQEFERSAGRVDKGKLHEVWND